MDADSPFPELKTVTDAAETLLGDAVLAAGFFRPMNLRVRRSPTWFVEIGRWVRVLTTQGPRVRHLPKVMVVAVTETSLAVFASDDRAPAHMQIVLGPWALPARDAITAGPDGASLRLRTSDGRSVDLQGLVPIDAAASVVRAALGSAP